jgi:hypothetical protein
MRHFAAFCSAALAVASCGRQSYEPARAPGVPAEAVWAGGPDGGAWIFCRGVPNSPDHFTCNIYFDSTGEVWASGEYILRRSAWDKKKQKADFSPVSDVPSHFEFSSFDGTYIRLFKSPLLLVPKDEALAA